MSPWIVRASLLALLLSHPVPAQAKGGKAKEPGHSENIAPPHSTSQQRITDKGRIHFLESGDSSAPQVVLVHGFPDTALDWQPIADALDDRFHVYALDLAGFGASGRPEFLSYAVPNLAEYLLTFFDEVGIDKAHVVGLDLSQAVVLKFAAEHSKRVLSLTIGAAPVDPEVPLPALLGTLATSLQGEIEASRLDKILGKYVQEGAATPASVPMARVEILGKSYNAKGATKALLEWIRSVPPETWRLKERAEKLAEVPLLILWGEKDPYLSSQDTQELKKLWKRAVVTLLPGAGHFLALEQPQGVAAAILAFLPAPEPPPADVAIALAGWQGETLTGTFSVRNDRKKRVRMTVGAVAFERVGPPVTLPGRQPVPLMGPEGVKIQLAEKPVLPEDKLTLEPGKPPLEFSIQIALPPKNFQFGERYRVAILLTPDVKDGKDLLPQTVSVGIQVLRLEEEKPSGLHGDPSLPPVERIFADPPPPPPPGTVPAVTP